MKNLSLLLVCFMMFSCEKEIEFPDEFNLIIGDWKAYEYVKITNFGSPNSYSYSYSTDSLGIEYSILISSRKIEIINSQTKSHVEYIRKVETTLNTSDLINFRLSTYSYLNFQNHECNLLFRENINELQVESCVPSSPNGGIDYCEIYKLKRIL